MFISFEYLIYIAQLLLKLWAVEKVLSIAVSGESFKFFDPRTLNWRPFEIFAKLNGKDILLEVFAKFAEYQSNVLIEMHNFG